ncbi:DUF4199 domain-containing protein [Aquimarina spinulae]|uniref:DUF4199 domain-containing protein n=1 Tax=Aquimarina spinulae TaxID=1192023 RepID=UPI000D55878E|nr:DUF4199 domain-containing protein [Aquimarina spinulae]
MEETIISTKKYIVNYGLILGFIWVTYGLIRYLTNNITTNNLILPIIELSIHISIIIYSIYIYKSANHGFLKLGQALKIGFSVALIGISIQILWDILLLKVIAPELIDQLMSLNKNQVPNEPLNENYISDKKNNFLFNISLVTFIGNSILGFLISLIGGAIMQKNRDVF